MRGAHASKFPFQENLDESSTLARPTGGQESDPSHNSARCLPDLSLSQMFKIVDVTPVTQYEDAVMDASTVLDITMNFKDIGAVSPPYVDRPLQCPKLLLIAWSKKIPTSCWTHGRVRNNKGWRRVTAREQVRNRKRQHPKISVTWRSSIKIVSQKYAINKTPSDVRTIIQPRWRPFDAATLWATVVRLAFPTAGGGTVKDSAEAAISKSTLQQALMTNVMQAVETPAQAVTMAADPTAGLTSSTAFSISSTEADVEPPQAVGSQDDPTTAGSSPSSQSIAFAGVAATPAAPRSLVDWLCQFQTRMVNVLANGNCC